MGRDRELALLDGWLDEALAGNPRVVLCSGEPGIGKTRLAEELAQLARARRVPAAWGRGVESEGAPPYWPWQEVIRSTAEFVDVVDLADGSLLTDHVRHLLPGRLPAGSGTADAGSSEVRFAQFDGVSRLLRQVAGRTPLVVVLDDAQWADQPSLLLLQHVVRTLSDERLLVLVNHRDTENGHSALLTGMLRDGPTRAIRLSGLGEAEVGRQLALALSHDVDSAQAAKIRALTGGNPFFVGEIARAMDDAHAPNRGSVVTVSVRDAIATRLRRLSPGCVELLQAASIIGREVSAPLLAAVADLPVATCLGRIDEAVDAGLLVTGATPARHQFVHALVRDAIEAGLPTPERVRLHHRAALAIEEVYAGQLELHLFDLARHWAVAAVQGDASTAVTWIRRAAEEALNQLAFEEAARLFRLALDVGGGAVSDDDRCRMLLALAGALGAAADFPGRLDACLQAAAISRRTGSAELLAEAALLLEGVFGHPDTDLAAKRLGEEALRLLDPAATPLRARVTARVAEACMYLGDAERAERASEDALALAQDCADRGAMVAALHARRLVCEGPDGVEERERLSDWMLNLSSADRDPRIELWAHLWRVDASFERGDLLAAGREIAAAELPAKEVGGRFARWHVVRAHGVLAQAQGRFADARRLASEAFDVIAPTGHPIAALPRAALLQMVGHHVGHDHQTMAANQVTEAPVDSRPFTRSGSVMLVLGPAYLLADLGRVPEAADLYRSLGPVAGWRPTPHATLAAYALGIAVAVALDEPDDVARLRALMAGHRGRHVASGAGAVAYTGPVELWLGIAGRHLGLYDEAAADLEEAVRTCAINGAKGYHAEALHELAATLAARAEGRDLARARSLVADAARRATELGMALVASRSAQLIQQLTDEGPSNPLTPREHEVAELVTKGLTSREIAGRLYLSERTVQNHVQHILTKLDLSNRSQIAVWVTMQK
ncbi:helix-turn-helix transcriptional regulator [Nocardioides antri]|uniref:helix-turn-helix transcriptional regulator n=1 Tax=Nocardioides antri TaxID=2607659 RepID=UPI00165ECF0E|nr:AAA family ATPase [Nocardioides antri]